jgi:hypothetical protein
MRDLEGTLVNIHRRTVIALAHGSSTVDDPVGFWWAELTHAYWEFTEHGYQGSFASPAVVCHATCILLTSSCPRGSSRTRCATVCS